MLYQLVEKKKSSCKFCNSLIFSWILWCSFLLTFFWIFISPGKASGFTETGPKYDGWDSYILSKDFLTSPYCLTLSAFKSLLLNSKLFTLLYSTYYLLYYLYFAILYSLLFIPANSVSIWIHFAKCISITAWNLSVFIMFSD